MAEHRSVAGYHLRLSFIYFLSTLSLIGALADVSTMRQACRQSLEVGRCTEIQERYYYNVTNDQCEMFQYGGCDGNLNRFESFEECKATCQIDACEPITCMMECSSDLGFDVDATGCQICQCRIPDICPIAVCVDPCPNGYTQDSKGCQSCECTTAPPPGLAVCPLGTCTDQCPRGYALDSHGCQSCDCIVPRSDCNGVACLINCPNGQMLDPMSGCPICACVEQPVCVQGMCAMYCELGFKRDDKGCSVCACVEQPVCAQMVCAMYCEFGFKHDDKGCSVCACDEDPCTSLKCTEDEVCVRSESRLAFTASCQPGRRWCPLKMCRMYCQHGFVTDPLGCETCRCRQTPPTSCPEIPPACLNECPFGYTFDENSCASCKCLPNACLDLSCPRDDQVCESYVHRNCPRCPVTPRCIDGVDVRRVHISLTYKHENISEFSDDEFGKSLVTSIAGLINVRLSNIVGVFLSNTALLTYASLHLIYSTDLHLVYLFNSLKADIISGREGAQILLGASIFTPDPMSLTAIYYSSASMDVGEEESQEDVDLVDPERDSVLNIVILTCVVVGVILLISTVCVCTAVCYRNRNLSKKARNNIYRPITRA